MGVGGMTAALGEGWNDGESYEEIVVPSPSHGVYIPLFAIVYLGASIAPAGSPIWLRCLIGRCPGLAAITPGRSMGRRAQRSDRALSVR